MKNLEKSEYDSELQKLHNLVSFNINFSSYANIELLKQDPSYILEKFNHWIGGNFSDKIIKEFDYDLISNKLKLFIDEYNTIWGSSDKVIRHLCCLKSSDNLNVLNMAYNFEKYFGPISLISSEKKTGLHTNINTQFVPEILEANQKNIQILLKKLR